MLPYQLKGGTTGGGTKAWKSEPCIRDGCKKAVQEGTQSLAFASLENAQNSLETIAEELGEKEWAAEKDKRCNVNMFE